MKLLFDENLSPRLVRALSDVYAGSAHVYETGLHAVDDAAIWTFAANHGYMVVSKDADFYQRSLVFGAPPKVVWVRVGNGPTGQVARLLRENRDLILRFQADPETALLVLPPRAVL